MDKCLEEAKNICILNEDKNMAVVWENDLAKLIVEECKGDTDRLFVNAVYFHIDKLHDIICRYEEYEGWQSQQDCNEFWLSKLFLDKLSMHPKSKDVPILANEDPVIPPLPIEQFLPSPSEGDKTSEKSPFPSNRFSSVAQALDYNPAFKSYDVVNSKADTLSLGIDPYKIYSYNPKLNGKKCPDENYGETLLKKVQLRDSMKYLKEAEEYCKSGNVPCALNSLDLALSICPENEKVYEFRAKMYLQIAKYKPCSKFAKAVLDLEKILGSINPLSQVAKEEYSKGLLLSARRFRKKKLYEKANDAVMCALALDDKNERAKKFSTSLLKKHLPVVVDLEDKSMDILENYKKTIQAELCKSPH